MPDKKPIEVRPDGGQWVVARQGSSRALSKHPTQKEAEPVGRERARKDKVEFILKGRDGQIRVVGQFERSRVIRSATVHG